MVHWRVAVHARIVARAGHICGAELVLTRRPATGHLPAETARTSTSFTIFEGTSEIQRLIIGRAVTGLDVR
jgi:alkylation response protein AidB-like acyl-CoA dehydrogenase